MQVKTLERESGSLFRTLQVAACLVLAAASMAPSGHNWDSAKAAENAEARQAVRDSAHERREAARAAQREERALAKSNRQHRSSADPALSSA